ncbi:hypothetical protein K1719_044349 [Acacia pycnantha]|nr:hypothetical protein K1719_044349 [Acacia pycnantha]
MAASTTMVNDVTAMMEELYFLLWEELREVSDGLNRKLAHLEDLVRQLQILLLLGQQPPGPPRNNNRHWTEAEIQALIQLRVQYPFENPGPPAARAAAARPTAQQQSPLDGG